MSTPATGQAAGPAAGPPPFTARPDLPGRPNADPFAGGGPTVVLRSSADLAAFVALGGHVADGRGPFSITRATLTNGRSAREVYLVALSGTHFGWARDGGQPTGIQTDVRSGLNIDNRYLQAARAQILATVPPGASLVVAGHSLGGMVAQQVTADPTVKERYDVLHTVAFGSPPLGWNRQEGEVSRLSDAADVVPRLSLEAHVPFFAGQDETVRFSGTLNPVEAHTSSYVREDVWRGLNAVGERADREGPATLTFRREDVEFFRATPGTRSPWLADVGAPAVDRVVRVASPLTAPALPGEAVRQAVAAVFRSPDGPPDAAQFEATYRTEQSARVADVLEGRGLAARPEAVAALMQLAGSFGPDQLTVGGLDSGRRPEPPSPAAALAQGPAPPSVMTL